MTPRPCYPMSIPRGARLVREGVIVEDLAVWNDGAVVAILGDDGCTRLYDPKGQLQIDENTPQRQGRLQFAREILAQADAGVPLEEMQFSGGGQHE